MAARADAPGRDDAVQATREWIITTHHSVRALLIVAQPVLAESITRALDHGVYLTRTAPAPEEARVVLRDWQPHLAVVDLDLAEGETLDWLGNTVPGAERLPVIALTRRGDLHARLAAFSRGADDVLRVPFAPEELDARALVLVRRIYREARTFTPALRLGELELDPLNHRVWARGQELRLTALEQGLLYLLAANAGRVVTRDEILDHLWGADYVAESNVVDRHIRHLRATLQDNWRRPRYIATVPGQGYRFVPTAADEARPASTA